MPASLIEGFKIGIGDNLSKASEDETFRGAIVVSPEALKLEREGGVAEKAGAGAAVAAHKVSQAKDKVKPKAEEAAQKAEELVNKGAYNLGVQLSKTRGMFSNFKDECKKPRSKGRAMKANSDIAPEIPEADFNEAKVAFEESLGSNFGTASILEEEEEAPTLTSANPARIDARSSFTMRQISRKSDHRTAGHPCTHVGCIIGMHKFYLGYHRTGILVVARYDHPRNALIWHRYSGHLDGRWCRRDHLSFQSRRKNSNKFTCRGYADNWF